MADPTEEASTRENSELGSVIIDGVEKTYRKGYTQKEYTPWIGSYMSGGSGDAVNGDFVTDYLNRADVREALHIPTTVQPY